jgi:hypothetical protein
MISAGGPSPFGGRCRCTPESNDTLVGWFEYCQVDLLLFDLLLSGLPKPVQRHEFDSETGGF